MNRINNYQDLLKEANEDLAKHNKEIIIKEEEGQYDVIIHDTADPNKEDDYFAGGYYEDELGEVVNDAWVHAKAKANGEGNENVKKSGQTVFVITENRRDEKSGDSTETVKVVGTYTDGSKAQNKLMELFDKAQEEALKRWDNEDLSMEIGPYGAQIYLDCEWDTFHIDYTVLETNLE